MKKNSTIFLQLIIILVGIGVFLFMLWEPHIEGRNVHATVFQIYFNDPFLMYAYIGSISFFVALYQAFKVLGYVRQNKTFSQATVKAIKTIKYSAIVLFIMVGAALAYLCIVRPGDDIAGGVFVSLLMIIVSGITVSVAGMFEQFLQNALDITSDRESTI
jgi:hypothetical protein